MEIKMLHLLYWCPIIRSKSKIFFFCCVYMLLLAVYMNGRTKITQSYHFWFVKFTLVLVKRKYADLNPDPPTTHDYTFPLSPDCAIT